MSEGAPRYFTLEEANTALAIIRPLLSEILEIRQIILDRQSDLWPVIEKSLGNGGSRTASQTVREFERFDRLVRQVMATGALIKDINSGLVDFPALRDGREVYLCWKFDEDGVRFWHDVDSGFAGRQPW
ncbi:MAG: DUF2203 domain-containing protein [Anaerolineales bacterium]|nr:DUF2203 domain-containing protein [Anaerolineales bacterium]